MSDQPRVLNAGNVGPFTLDGTRTYLVGRNEVAVIDPGPDVDSHVRALASEVAEAHTVRILLTHGHGDHAGAARNLAEAVDAEVWGPKQVGAVDRPIGDGDQIATDEGDLIAVHTPGHSRDHLSFHWPARRALFVGDHLLGDGDTTWVAEYPGCVADYLASLARLRSFELDVLFPAHGPPLEDPTEAFDRYEAHRRERIAQVAWVLKENPALDLDAVIDRVYGDLLPTDLRGAAASSLSALLHHVRTHPEA